ncbi:Zn-dependent exopeptidase M28 [Streptomyces sp. WAC07149]|uniref:M28 family metallopeptidase n=1 Tax=Streptomyces sp. WAC07149 TaxID=2487425 RepID=UPI000F7A78CD|nr:M28 family metallopeptidase [Streptomyces sp. WAC07149]RST01827.1 Zn-dependent exopeptidase M28 [Streptomyces sp. WAC07149]
MSVLFFDIGATLADARMEPDGSLTLRPRPRVAAVLDALAAVRRGIISNPGPGDGAAERAAAALGAAFPGRFTEAGLVHWGVKDGRGIFDRAVASAGGVPADGCVFVGEDAQERAFAREAGMRTAPHPVFAPAAMEGRAVFFARIGLPEGRGLAELAAVAETTEAVPVHVASERLVLVMASGLGAEVLERAGFTVELREPVEDRSAFLVRDEGPGGLAEPQAGAAGVAGADGAAGRAEALYGFVAGALAAGGAPPAVPLGPAPGGVYLAVPAGARVEEVHRPGARPGDTECLLPDPALLSRPGEGAGRPGAGVRGAASGDGLPSAEVIAAVRATVTAEVLRGHVARLSGAGPLVEGEPVTVRSRDAAAQDNELVVEALAGRFQELGLRVRRHPFRWRGRQLFNVEAEHRVAGADSAVLVTAHLDSTASGGEFTDEAGAPRPYDPAVDPAPGADDDGSGTAGVLAAAECLASLLAAGARPVRSVRFVLFNAEEQGLVGSKFYARAAAAEGDRIAGVFQMDMIAGLRRGAVPRVEIHAGSAVPGPVVGASDALGELVARTLAAFDPAVTVQQLTGPADPAVGRSDHASFHERGWAAVAVSEDLFSTPEGAPGTGTRQYHTPGDTLLDEDHDSGFAATIAGSVTATALAFAGL